jgi:hypothetical protein
VDFQSSLRPSTYWTPAGHIQGTIIGEELHDRVEIVSIERIEDGFSRFGRN